MGISVESNNSSHCPISKSEIDEVIRKTLTLAGIKGIRNKRLTVSVAFVDEGSICRLNEKYRGKKGPTDILSFSEYGDKKSFLSSGSGDIFLGEMVVCCEYVKKSAIIGNRKFESDLRYVISHGMLHLLGFSHGKEMFDIQEKLL